MNLLLLLALSLSSLGTFFFTLFFPNTSFNSELTGVVDDSYLFDVAEHLDADERSQHLCRVHAAASRTHDECLVRLQLEKVIWTASGVATRDDSDARTRADDHVWLGEDVFHIVLVSGLEVKLPVGREVGVASMFARHFEPSANLDICTGWCEELKSRLI